MRSSSEMSSSDEESVRALPRSRRRKRSSTTVTSRYSKKSKRGHQDASSDEEIDLALPSSRSKFSKLIKSQSLRVKKRLPSSIRKGKGSRRKTRALPASSSSESSEDEKDLEEQWDLTLLSLPRTFLARQSAKDFEKSGTTPFKGVPLSADNSMDLKSIYDVTCSSYGDLGSERAIFKGLRSVVGQFVRFLAAHGNIPHRVMRTLWKEGKLFSTLVRFDAIRVFIGNFKEHNAVTTVAFKAGVMLSFFDYAEQYLRRNGMTEKSEEAKKITDFLRQTRSSYKTQGRKVAAARKCSSVRNRLNTILLPEDFARFSREAQDDLNGLMMTFAREVRKSSKKDKTKKLYRYFARNPRLIQKWCINLIATLVLNCGGQRPQAYVQLQCPAMSRFRQIDSELERAGYFTLRTLREKRTREPGLPEVIIPAYLFSVICFHAEYIRPYLLFEDPCEVTPLLIDTREGTALKEKAITATIRAFLKRRDPELAWVTMANIRSSYATMAITRHRAGTFFDEMDEKAFVAFLARVMNTSEEMISRTYAAAGQESIKETCARVSKLVQDIEESDLDEQSEKEEPEKEGESDEEDAPTPYKRFEI